ncbi:zinc finger BED domain-containing protein RICESLEEPER 2-like [Syzygium oleosum]|uniref:zinc finger BED domain-containing protein RICESLEEPER 2-like n=1 Tax=Syzygium oleosum TaxID=219896 RepID=UPI0024B9ACAE|nr:zinc finger BED domain-containing protein RICESLEEPER 2-like [Syzygium oleosum]
MLVLIAVVLDPKAKLSYVNFLYGQIYDDELKVNEMHYKVKVALERLYEFYEQSSLASSDRNFGAQSLSASSSGSNADAGGSEGSKIKKYDAQAWRKTFMHSNQHMCNDNKSELDQYLEEKNENILDLDLLMWWKTSGSKYKILSLMARDVLSIPVTTVASESTFSTSGRVLDSFRSSLTPKVVEALICTQDWLRAVRVPIDVEECIENAEKFEMDMDCLNEEIIVSK